MTDIIFHDKLTKSASALVNAYKGPLLRSENYLFHMPVYSEYFMAALAAVEAFYQFRETNNTAAAMNNSPYGDFQIYLDYPGEFEFMIPEFLKPVTRNLDWDLEIYLEAERASNLIEASDRSLADGFGILIGADIETHFPSKLVVGDLKEAEPTVLIFTDIRVNRLFSDLGKLLMNNFEYLSIVSLPRPDGDALEKILPWIKRSAVVIGIQSAETYMACCQKRLTIEISPGRPRNFMAKWSNPYYSLIQVDGLIQLVSLTPTSVFRAFKTKAESCNLRSRVRCT